MKKIASVMIFAALVAGYVNGQDVRLTFDDDQSDFGAFETSGTLTELTLSRSGGTIATNDFTELDGLTSETYTVSGAELGALGPFSFTVAATGGSAFVDGTGLDVGGSGMDSGETLTFTFTRDITLTQFDLASMADSEFATVTVGGSAVNYDGSASGDAQDVTLSLDTGESLVFSFAATDGADYDIQGISFTVVPEPQTFALLAGFCGLTLVMLRRRK